MSEVVQHDASVLLLMGDEDEELSPTAARELAVELIRAARQADSVAAANKALCASDGHVWHGWDSWEPYAGSERRKVFRESCTRPGCDARQLSDGWRAEYPQRDHVTLGGTVRCPGAECDWCDAEQLGVAVQSMLSDALVRIDRFMVAGTVPDSDGSSCV